MAAEPLLWNLGMGIGMTTAAVLLTLPYYGLLKVMGFVAAKPVIVPPQLIKEDRVNGVKEWSEPVVIESKVKTLYDNCSEDFQGLLWFLLWAAPVGCIALASIGLANLVIYSRG